VISFWFCHSILGKARGCGQPNRDVEFILQGVDFVDPGNSIPSFLTVDGENSFPILVGKYGNIRLPIMAGSRKGKGRIVVFAHTNFLGKTKDGIKLNINTAIILNSVKWASAYKKNISGILHIIKADEPYFISLFSQNGISIQTVVGNKLLSDVKYLKSFDFLIISHFDGAINKEVLLALRNYVLEGGALLLGGTAWSYHPPTGQSHQTSYFGNRILQYLGAEIQFIPWKAQETVPGGFSTSRDLLCDTHSQLAFKKIIKSVAVGHELLPERAIQLTQVVKTQLMFGLRDLSKNDNTVFEKYFHLIYRD